MTFTGTSGNCAVCPGEGLELRRSVPDASIAGKLRPELNGRRRSSRPRHDIGTRLEQDATVAMHSLGPAPNAVHFLVATQYPTSKHRVPQCSVFRQIQKWSPVHAIVWATVAAQARVAPPVVTSRRRSCASALVTLHAQTSDRGPQGICLRARWRQARNPGG
jgi:hypothetical protein